MAKKSLFRNKAFKVPIRMKTETVVALNHRKAFTKAFFLLVTWKKTLKPFVIRQFSRVLELNVFLKLFFRRYERKLIGFICCGSLLRFPETVPSVIYFTQLSMKFRTFCIFFIKILKEKICKISRFLSFHEARWKKGERRLKLVSKRQN